MWLQVKLFAVSSCHCHNASFLSMWPLCGGWSGQHCFGRTHPSRRWQTLAWLLLLHGWNCARHRGCWCLESLERCSHQRSSATPWANCLRYGHAGRSIPCDSAQWHVICMSCLLNKSTSSACREFCRHYCIWMYKTSWGARLSLGCVSWGTGEQQRNNRRCLACTYKDIRGISTPPSCWLICGSREKS